MVLKPKVFGEQASGTWELASKDWILPGEQRRVRGPLPDTGQGDAEGAGPRGTAWGEPKSEPEACLSPVGVLRGNRKGTPVQSCGCSREP